jgi:DNA-binding CsgD family transcriptional regulator
MVARSGAILQAVQRIHEAPLARDGWERALAAVTLATGGDRAFMFIQRHGRREPEWMAGFDMGPQHLQRLGAAVEAGVLPDWAPALPPGTVTSSSAMLSDHDFARSAFYNEVVRPVGDFYGLAASLLRERQRDVYLAVGRRLGRPDYDTGEREALAALLPHLATAIRVGWHIDAAERRADSLDAALEGLATGVILVDASASILFLNVTAERLLASGRGLCADKDGLCGVRAADTRALRRLVQACAGQPVGSNLQGGEMALASPANAAPLRVVVSPYLPGSWAGSASFSHKAAIVLVSDPQPVLKQRREFLRRRFGLTPAEALVMLEIASAQGRGAAARRLGISEATLKTHLVHIFAKTGVSRQAELVRLLFEGQAGLPPR